MKDLNLVSLMKAFIQHVIRKIVSQKDLAQKENDIFLIFI